ncbi:Protein F21D5.6 [Aphelenchoides avenae]|nr:Protein F21D5.6 [Aphelenchus avenae]
MVGRTRRAAVEDDDEAKVEVPATKPSKITSDPASHKRFVLCKEQDLKSGIHALQHPRYGTRAMYQISAESPVVTEVLVIDDQQRSFFYGETVIRDGSITLMSPVHPLFLALPYLLKNANDAYQDLWTCLKDEDFPAAIVLAENEVLLRSLKKAMDCKVLESSDGQETCLYRYNETKLMEWLKKRFDSLKAAMLADASLHKSISGDDVVLRRYTFGILADYLPEEVNQKLKVLLEIRDPELAELVAENTGKRKALIAAENELDAPLVKKATPLTTSQKTAQKKLAQASKGTKPLTSFFTKNV